MPAAPSCRKASPTVQAPSVCRRCGWEWRAAMTRNATRSWRYASAGIAGVAVLLAAPAAARQDDRAGAREVALAPLSDLNLRRDPIPDALIRARLAPYASEGLDDCTGIREEIGNLDAVLGEDL